MNQFGNTTLLNALCIAAFVLCGFAVNCGRAAEDSFYQADSDARDPFMLSSKLQAEIARLQMENDIVKNKPQPDIEAPPKVIPIAAIHNAVKLQAVMTNGSNQFAIINGKLVRIGDSFNLQIDDDNIQLKIVKLQAGPPRVTMQYLNQTLICTLKSQGE